MAGVIASFVLVVIDIAWIIAVSIVIGATAPRWPDRWLGGDPVPLLLLPWESARFFRRLGVPWLSRHLPELGATFGGESKSALPGLSRSDLGRFLIEVRRAEWVHWLSIAATVVLFAFNPWWLALAFVVAVAVGNLPFILVLRNNRRRLVSVIGRG